MRVTVGETTGVALVWTTVDCKSGLVKPILRIPLKDEKRWYALQAMEGIQEAMAGGTKMGMRMIAGPGAWARSLGRGKRFASSAYFRWHPARTPR